MNAEEATTSSREETWREKRGQGLAARDAVRREGNCFVVSTFSFRRGGASNHKVSRDDTGRVRCTCAEFELESRTDQAFRCEHIHAVKFWQKKQLNRELQRSDESEIRESRGEMRTACGASSRDRLSATDDEKGRRKMSVRRVEAQLNGDAGDTTERATASRGRGAVESENETADAATAAAHPSSADSENSSLARVEFKRVLSLLRQPIDAKLIRAREGWTDRRGNKHMVEYVEWHTVADILDRICPAWSHRVQSITQVGEVVAVVASITISNVTREGVGTGACDTETGIKKAEHDALKRAAVKFGIARELYQRETEAIEGESNATASSRAGNSFGSAVSNNRGGGQDGFRGFPPEPQAKGMSDLVTPKQLGMINRLAREAGVSAEEECSRLMNCKLEDLSKRAASSLIDYLKEYPESANKLRRRAS